MTRLLRLDGPLLGILAGLALALALPLLTSCAPDLQALAADKNADCITLTTIWSTLKIDRSWGCSPAPPSQPGVK